MTARLAGEGHEGAPLWRLARYSGDYSGDDTSTGQPRGIATRENPADYSVNETSTGQPRAIASRKNTASARRAWLIDPRCGSISVSSPELVDAFSSTVFPQR